ncbi:MAG: hypothetical protein ACRDTR_17565 [Rubrobacter sp.]
MEAHKTDVVVEKGRTVTISNLPFSEGEKVEVVLRQRATPVEGAGAYAPRGEPVRYVDPFDSVVEDDWEALN